MSAKIQALEKLIKTDHRDIQIQPEIFKGGLISALPYKVREKQTKDFKQPILIYPATSQEVSNGR